jgi:hypothetical protein
VKLNADEDAGTLIGPFSSLHARQDCSVEYFRLLANVELHLDKTSTVIT